MSTRSRCSVAMMMIPVSLAGTLLHATALAAKWSSTPAPPAGTVELYKPNYITWDWTRGDNWQAKFQTSVRMNLVPVISLYLGFTQESFWDLPRESAPFREHDFNPDLFLRFSRHPADTALVTVFDHVRRAQIGVEHLSTGVSGPNSRGMNMIYANLRLDYDTAPWWRPNSRERKRLSIYPRLWLIFNRSDENRDIVRYTGFGHPIEFGANLIVVGRVGNLLRPALEVGKRYFQLELGVRPGPTQNFHLYARYWNGIGEGFVDYDEFSQSLGIGISFIAD